MLRKSAISYMGNKFKLLPQMLPLFPKNIGNFWDLFGGSGTVSINVKAERVHLNELSKHLFGLYEMFKTVPADEIISFCEEMQDRFGLSKDITSKPEMLEHNRAPYRNARKWVNENPSPLGFYFLGFYSFCNQLRFNKGKFNMPLGNGYFKEESKALIKGMCEILSQERFQIHNGSYQDLEPSIREGDFAYCDCPYSNTEAVYNSNWGEKDDLELFAFLERLDGKGVEWALSNCFENKGKANPHLREWCERKGWFVVHLSASYASHRVNRNPTDEVLVCNYEPKDKTRLF